MKKAMRKHGGPEVMVTDRRRSYGAALKEIGAANRLLCGRLLKSRAENSHLPFRRRERAMLRFRRMRNLQKFVAVHASIYNLFNSERSLYTKPNFKLNRTAALAEWRGLCAEQGTVSLSFLRLVRIGLPAPFDHFGFCQPARVQAGAAHQDAPHRLHNPAQHVPDVVAALGRFPTSKVLSSSR
jgi:hypothetical protein